MGYQYQNPHVQEQPINNSLLQQQQDVLYGGGDEDTQYMDDVDVDERKRMLTHMQKQHAMYAGLNGPENYGPMG